MPLFLMFGCRPPAQEPLVEAPPPTVSASAPAAVGAAGASPCSTKAALPGISERGVRGAGDRRSYRLVVPETYDAAKPARLLLAFHGYGQPLDSAQRSELVKQAGDAGYLVALPQGGSLGPSPTCWNAGACCAPCSLLGFDDIAFTRAVIADVKGSHCVDPQRVYVAGFSNGAMMAYRLACSMGDELAAVAAVSGTLVAPECDGAVKKPPSLMIAHGTDDEIVPFGGGSPKWAAGLTFDWPGMRDVAVRFQTILGCSKEPNTITVIGGTQDHYRECVRGRELEVDTIENGRHRWPRNGFTENVLAFFDRNPRVP